jgi:hypothetical protein
MRRRTNLRALDRHARKKLSRFGRRVKLLGFGRDDKGRSLDLHQRETELALVVINIQSYWSNWSRAFYLSAALGAVSASGSALSSTLGLVSEHDALTVAIKGSLHPTRSTPMQWPSSSEPLWYSPAALSRSISHARINSAGALAIFLNSAPLGLSHLRVMRNYYAHRSEFLRREALAIGPTYLVGRARRPSEILLFVEPTRTVCVLERWILQIQRLASALCV